MYSNRITLIKKLNRKKQMKALFLIFHGFVPHNGISKKIGYQMSALQQCGVDIRLCYLSIDQDGYHKRMLDDEVLENFGKGDFAKIKKRIRYAKLTDYIIKNDIKFLYIRSFHNANPFLNRMLKKLKHAGVKLVMEIPTYPYDQEYQHAPFSLRIVFILDKIFRNQLARQLYRIVTFSNDQVIFGVPAINLSNGIDFDQIKMKTTINNHPGRLHLIGVAEIHFWHGFDRVISGLAEYYKNKIAVMIYFDIVGYGDQELKKLQDMVVIYNLEKYVTFHGPKTGAELDRLFEKADMGVASLARHRSGITRIKPLKNREYAARGIPFIYSEIDDDFEQMPYVMKAPADESPLDMGKVIDFFYKRKFDPMEIRSSIIHSLSWKVQMKKVIDILEKSV